MLEIGTKIKFSSYIPKNIISNKALRKTIVEGERIFTGRCIDITRTERTVTFRTSLIQENVVLDGTYVGKFRKKLARTYNKTQPEDVVELVQNPFGVGLVVTTRRMPTERRRYDRYSDNPRRKDNPRKLDEVALVKYGRFLLGVPMDDLLKHTYGRKTTTL